MKIKFTFKLNNISVQTRFEKLWNHKIAEIRIFNLLISMINEIHAKGRDIYKLWVPEFKIHVQDFPKSWFIVNQLLIYILFKCQFFTQLRRSKFNISNFTECLFVISIILFHLINQKAVLADCHKFHAFPFKKFWVYNRSVYVRIWIEHIKFEFKALASCLYLCFL